MIFIGFWNGLFFPAYRDYHLAATTANHIKFFIERKSMILWDFFLTIRAKSGLHVASILQKSISATPVLKNILGHPFRG
jgi:hypothetical protein